LDLAVLVSAAPELLVNVGIEHEAFGAAVALHAVRRTQFSESVESTESTSTLIATRFRLPFESELLLNRFEDRWP